MCTNSCPSCGKEWDLDRPVRYCGWCGSPLEGEDDSNASGGESSIFKQKRLDRDPRGELRYATVLFADIKGFTEFSEGRDPDVVAEVVGNLLEQLGNTVRDLGGSVDKYLGDAVMATFGLDRPDPHAARTAVQTGFRLQDTIERFSKKNNMEFQLRVGVHAGEVMRIQIGEGYTVMGDTVNTAARIEGKAPEGGVLISGPVARDLKGQWDLTEVDEVELKGKTEPTSLYEVNAELEPAKRDIYTRSQFEGRDAEKDNICRMIEEGSEIGGLNIVFVRGETGLGKSRLIREVHDYVRGNEYEWSEVQYDTMLSGMVEGTGQFVREHFGVENLQDPEQVHQQILNEIERNGTWLDDERSQQASEFFSFLLGVEREDFEIAELEGDEKVKGAWLELKNLMDWISTEDPLVWCLEDVQKADGLTARFLEWGLDMSWEGNVTVLATVREEEFDETATWYEHLQNFLNRDPAENGNESNRVNSFTLDELETDELSRALQTILPGGISEEVTESVAEHCEGNPLFGVETILEFHESGFLEQQEDDEMWRLAVPWEDVEFPGTLREVMDARLQKLPRISIEAAKRGGVMGQRFFRSPLSRIWDDEESDLGESLQILTEAKIAFMEESSFLQDEREGIFKNARFQEAAESRATNRERKRWLAEVADWCDNKLDTVENPKQPAQVLLPLEGRSLKESENPGEARAVYEQSGWILHESHRLEEAVGDFRNSLFGLHENNHAIDNQDEEFWDRIYPSWDPSGNLKQRLQIREAVLLFAIADCRKNFGRIEEALSTLKKMDRVLENVEEKYPASLPEPPYISRFQFRRTSGVTEHSWWNLLPEELRTRRLLLESDLLERRGEMEQAETMITRARDSFVDQKERLPEERRNQLFENWLSRKLWFVGEAKGQPVEALDFLESIEEGNQPELMNIYDLEPEDIAEINHIRAVLLYTTGNYEEALDIENSLVEFWSQREQRSKTGPMMNIVGMIHQELGNLDEAENVLQETHELFQTIGRRFGEAGVLGNLGGVYLQKGNLEQAEECFRNYLDVSREIGHQKGEATAQGQLGLVYLERGELDRAGECFKEEIKMSERIGNQRGKILALGNLGFVYHERRNYDLARNCYEQQLERSKEIEFPYGTAIALSNLAELLRNQFAHPEEESLLTGDEPGQALRFTEEGMNLVKEAGYRNLEVHMRLHHAILLRWAAGFFSGAEGPGDEELRDRAVDALRDALNGKSNDEASLLERAAEEINSAVELLDDVAVEPPVEAEIYLEQSRIHLCLENPEQAADSLEHANSLISDTDADDEHELLRTELQSVQSRLESRSAT